MTDEQIEALRREAREAADYETEDLCTEALTLAPGSRVASGVARR